MTGTSESLGKPNKMLGYPCVGLASNPGGALTLLVASSSSYFIFIQPRIYIVALKEYS